MSPSQDLKWAKGLDPASSLAALTAFAASSSSAIKSPASRMVLSSKDLSTDVDRTGDASGEWFSLTTTLEGLSLSEEPDRQDSPDDSHQGSSVDSHDAKFHLFMNLPRELRDNVYEEVLVSDEPIVPQLCSCTSDEVKFFDQNQDGHGAVSERLVITQVSKQVREESVPIFYGSNTFGYGADLLTYFDVIDTKGCFSMIHNVEFPVHNKPEKSAITALKALSKTLAAQEDFEKEHDTSLANGSYSSLPPTLLREHPLHAAAGMHWLGTFLIARKLSTTYTASNDYEHYLVLSVGSADTFTSAKGTQWFQRVAECLGIKLKLVDNKAPKDLSPGHMVTWRKRFQKKADDDKKGDMQVGEGPQVLKKAIEMFTDLHEYPCAKKITYYRLDCDDAVHWYDIRTGLARSPTEDA